MSQTNRGNWTGCIVAVVLLAGMFLVFCVAIALLIVGLPTVEGLHGPGVAVLEIREELLDERGVIEDIEYLAEHPGAKALVLRVDSPGGVITVAEEVYKALVRVREQGMPIIASQGSTAASGAYFVCLAADKIYANDTSLTGSIGVIVEYTSPHQLFDAIGVEFDTIASGTFKTIGSWGEAMSPEQRAHLQALVNKFNDMFVELVAAERNMEIDKVRALADGRLFTGRDALEAGLVDEIGDLHAAILFAAQQAGIEGEPRIITPIEPTPSLFDLIDSVGSGGWAKLQEKVGLPRIRVR